jgi:hypothetical protein
MIKSREKLKDLESLLNKDNKILITSGIGLLREEKPFEGAIALLTSYYDNTDDLAIRKAIQGFMNDLKDQSVCEEVIIEIRKQWKPDTTSMLVSSCWQSRLNYSAYCHDLAEVFIRGDYVTAIECLTVIEESLGDLNKVQKDEILKLIKESPPSLIKEKTLLNSELIAMLSC